MSDVPAPLSGPKPATCQLSPTAPSEKAEVIWLLLMS
jgi:hypothetical protein